MEPNKETDKKTSSDISSELTFMKYPSMENASLRTIKYMKTHGKTIGTFIVSEKAHGANISLWVSDNNPANVRIGKRTSILTPIELISFYSAGVVLDLYKDKAVYVRESLIKRGLCDKCQIIVIYGELIGLTPDKKMIQKGVDYCSDLQIYAFDIRIGNTMQSRKCFEDAIKDSGIVFARTLFMGTFDATITWSREHNADPSSIPALYGYKPKESFIREGHVIVAYDAITHTIGIKDKNEKFCEVKPRKERVKEQELSEILIKAINIATRYITETRLDNVFSKEGPVAQITTNRPLGEETGPVDYSQIPKYIGIYAKDVIVDFKKDNGDLVKGMKPNDIKRLNKIISYECTNIVKRRFLE